MAIRQMFVVSVTRPWAASGRSPVSRRVTTPTEGNLAVEPEWRREVSTRLQDYRARRHGGAPAELQTALPFEHPHSIRSRIREACRRKARDVSPAPARQASTSAGAAHERYEISIPQCKLHQCRLCSVATVRPRGDPRLRRLSSVASFQSVAGRRCWMRRLLLFSYGGMLAFFTVLGGRIGWNKVDLTVVGRNARAVLRAVFRAVHGFRWLDARNDASRPARGQF